MTSKKIKQSHKEYCERKKRLEIKESYDQLENKKLNEIQDINKEIEKLLLKKEEREKECNEIELEKLKKMSMIYNDKDLLEEIIEYAKITTYSRTNLLDIEEIYKCGINEDNINWESIEKIAFAEEKINIEIQHTNLFIDVLSNIGDTIKFPGEEEDD